MRRRVYFSGVTGPDRSGGVMASAYVVCHDDLPVAASVVFIDQGPDSSWLSASYHALALVLEQWRGRLRVEDEFASDAQLLVQQMTGRRRAKSGHYMEAREDALTALAQAYPTRGDAPSFVWVERDRNPAFRLASDMLGYRGIRPWSYEDER